MWRDNDGPRIARQQNDQRVAAVSDDGVNYCYAADSGGSVGAPRDVDNVQIRRQRIVPPGVAVNDADNEDRRNRIDGGGVWVTTQQNDQRVAVVRGADTRGRQRIDDADTADVRTDGSLQIGRQQNVHVAVNDAGTGDRRGDRKSSTSEDESSSWTTIDGEQTDVNEGDAEAMTNVRAVGAERTDSAVAYQQEDLSLEILAEEQRRDTDIRAIMELLEEKMEKPSWDDVASRSCTTKALWQQWPRLVVRDGILYRRFEQLDGRVTRLQLVVPFKLRRQMFCAVHEGVTGGHMGRRRTEHQLQSRAYWPGWTGDVRRFLKMCDPCAQYHRGGPPKLATLKPFLAGDVFETVSIDVTGPHPRSRHGNVYMLTIMDHFSKWANAFPVTNHTAAVVARVLFNRVFVYLGMPLRILSD